MYYYILYIVYFYIFRLQGYNVIYQLVMQVTKKLQKVTKVTKNADFLIHCRIF